MRTWLGLLGLLSAPLLWADEAEDRLARMIQAQASQSYQGTFVYERQGSFVAHQLWRRAFDGQLRERLLQLDGMPRESLSENGRLLCMTGSADELQLPQRQQMLTHLDAQALSAHYQPRLLGSNRIAGREVEELALVPRDPHRYAMQLSLDRQTGLPLRSLLLGSQGQLLERLQFTEIQLQAPADEQLQAAADCRDIEPLAAARDAQVWRADWLPPGFVALATWRRASPLGDQELLTQVYGDGLASISVFIEPLREAQAGDAHSQAGPTAINSRQHSTPQGQFMVTVLGEVPPATVERVALSMRAPGGQP
ncbi:sigma-E factor negative regulatory protein RseB [Pseudomonas fluvialis]|uniref:Sigma-E factor negative regulatory protein RseB n=1 Tax=Pseudomonas fluvialis TaxID=1793966 RepID=A0A7X0BW11_9PSED|nr:MucB/RseB C-terminal domain-containing protein [Pseudomonas fluvialis]MBB6342134.1 sigma-E factor negative regulatory protein RseB [Pseudomonas fluvialis]